MDEEEAFSPVEKRRRSNAERQAAYRARKKEQEASVQPDDLKSEPDDIEVEFNEPEKKKPTLRERLGLGAKKDAPVKVATGRSKKTAAPNLMLTLMPGLLAAMIVTYARSRIAPRYQPCAPTVEEATAVIKPLMNILGRRVKVAVGLSADTIDLMNAIVCAMAYGSRAYVTYVEIAKDKRYEETPYAVPQPEVQTETYRPYQPDGGSNGFQPGGGSVASIASNGEPGDSELREWKAQQVTDLLRRDKQGRDQRGLF